jgi:hypothetical protein
MAESSLFLPSYRPGSAIMERVIRIAGLAPICVANRRPDAPRGVDPLGRQASGLAGGPARGPGRCGALRAGILKSRSPMPGAGNDWAAARGLFTSCIEPIAVDQAR